MFASKSLLVHLLRGAAGIAALVYSVSFAATQPWLSLAMLPIALVAFRGCPVCWTLGLIQTVLAKIQGKPTDGLCADGTCAVRVK